MPIAAGDLIEVKVFANFLGKQVLNRFFYVADDALSGLDGLFAKLRDGLVTVMASGQDSSLVYEKITLSDIDQAQTIFYEEALAITGALSDDCLPAFFAAGFKIIPATKSFRAGAKRMAGMTEIYNTNGVPNAAAIAWGGLVAAQIILPLVDSGGDTWTPVLGRYSGTLKLGYTAIEWTTLTAANLVRFTTQDSRK